MFSQWIPNELIFEYVLKSFLDASLKWTKTARYHGYSLKEDIFKNLAFACPQCDERGPSWIQIKDGMILEVGAHFKVGTELLCCSV